MANRLIKLALVEYIPAIPAVVPRPRYCTVRVVQRITTTGGNIYGATWGSGFGGDITSESINTPIPGAVAPPVTQYTEERITTCYPAIQGVDGVPARQVESPDIGWNAGAQSIGLYSGDFQVSFEFNPEGSGMLCGFVAPGSAPAAYNAVRHGFRLVSGELSVVESGRVVVAAPYSAGDVLSIQRIAGVVTYLVGDWRYTSAVPSTGYVSLGACLYISGDYVDNPVLRPIQTVQAYSDWGWADEGSAYRLSARSGWGWGSSATMGDGIAHVSMTLDVSASQTAQGSVRVGWGDITLDANDTPRLSVTGLSTTFPVGLTTLGSSVGVGSVVFDIGEAHIRASDYAYGDAQLIAAAVDVVAMSFNEAPGTGSASEALGVGDWYMTDPVLYAALNDTLDIGDTIDILLALDAGLVEYLIADGEVDATQVLQALLASGIQFTDNINSVRSAVLQYATNLRTGAVGRYEGFDFLGFSKVGMQTFGWKRDGLYRLGYAEDTGEEIQAMIDFAAEDFDTTHRKSIRALFFGVDTDGALYARLVDDNDCDATYRVIPHGDTQRANPAQRPTSRFWRLRLEIVDATFADLDNVEWKVATTGRRTRS